MRSTGVFDSFSKSKTNPSPATKKLKRIFIQQRFKIWVISILITGIP